MYFTCVCGEYLYHSIVGPVNDNPLSLLVKQLYEHWMHILLVPLTFTSDTQEDIVSIRSGYWTIHKTYHG